MSWHLDTRILRMLVAVAEAPSAARAAARLNITPSALSHQMRKAEADLRVVLFERRGSRVHLTLAAEQLCVAARAILARMEEAEGALERTRRGDRPTIRLGGGAYPVHRLLLGRVAPADLAQAAFVTRTRAYPPGQAVAEGELDLALVPSRALPRGAARVPLFEDALLGVVPAGHRLARARSLAEGPYATETYVSYSRVVEGGLDDDLLFRPNRSAPARFALAESVEAILDLVAAGQGFTILSAWSVPEGRPGLATLPLVPGGAAVGWSVVHREAERDAEVLAFRDRLVAALGPAGPAAGPATAEAGAAAASPAPGAVPGGRGAALAAG
jgi:LysR family transcriptional regulator for metE and metH